MDSLGVDVCKDGFDVSVCRNPTSRAPVITKRRFLTVHIISLGFWGVFFSDSCHMIIVYPVSYLHVDHI